VKNVVGDDSVNSYRYRNASGEHVDATPLDQTPGDSAAPEHLQNKAIGNILLVDDDPLFLELARTVLQKAGYGVISAVDGIEAVKLYSISYKEIGLVLSDISMPRMNGGDAMKLMRQVNPAVSVILISGHLEEPKRMMLLDAGATECFSKPDQPELLLEHVRRFLSPGTPNVTPQKI